MCIDYCHHDYDDYDDYDYCYAGDCWDQGGTTGEAWADKGGQQVQAVKNMIDRITGGHSTQLDV